MASIINATTTNGVAITPDNSGSLQLATNNGTTAVTIDTSQNVGIGTTTPTRKLTVYQNAAQVDLSIVSSTTGLAVIQMGDTAADNQGQIIYRNNGDSMEFAVNGAERMRITSGGQLLVGTTTGTTLSSVAWNTTLSGGGNNLAVVNTTTNGSTTSGFQASNYTGGGASIINFYNGSGGAAGSISVPTNGSTGTTVAYNTSSDYRMKENIAPMTGALNKVLQLNPVTYTWKSNGYAGQGFIAHELQAVVPDCVSGEKDAVDAEGNPIYQGVDTSFLVATLTAAIQELKAQLDESNLILTSVKTELDTVKAELNTLKNPPVEGTE